VDPDDAGLPSLEYYAGHRMTNDRHVLIWADGYRQHLDAIKGFIVWNPNVPGSREAVERAARERDGAIRRYLRDRGIYPGSGIHGYAGIGAIITDDDEVTFCQRGAATKATHPAGLRQRRVGDVDVDGSCPAAFDAGNQGVIELGRYLTGGTYHPEAESRTDEADSS
jgi:hypothetical protein